ADEVLDLTVIDPHLGVATARHEGVDLLARPGLGDDPIDDRQQLGAGLCRNGTHAAMPPIVNDLTRNVGWPSPTGTPWPSLPHVPGFPIAKSSASMSMSRSTWGPLPIRLPSRSGSVISPFSIRYASRMPNTKSPLAVLTWPPPSSATYTPCSVAA